ncbi:MAG: GIY-YIG nuclease family protein [Neisseriaceae bacterium]|nr:GIY-YIG nuclease family protein [Neisseriaceae bacterium]
MEKQGFVYILANHHNTVLYTGVTNDLIRRVYEHKNKFVEGFSKKYNVDKLVYYEVGDSILAAIEREKQIKKRSRTYKEQLITQFNPHWEDLYEKII